MRSPRKKPATPLEPPVRPEPTLELVAKPDEPEGKHVIVMDGRKSRELLGRIAFGALRGWVEFLQAQLHGEPPPEVQRPLQLGEPERDVMTADEVAAFLGVDRNTVYDYANRGVIPHQRLGKRILFRRGALVSWLDSSLCKATSTRKG